MKTFFSIGSIGTDLLARMCEGEPIGLEYSSVSITGICTDSREADRDTVFCALRGERVDGHDYIGAAIANGCRVILCEELREEIGAANAVAILCKNVEDALSKLAKNYRRNLSCQTVAVTGSVGKTTTKDMIAAVLSSGLSAFKTKGNFNSVIGMPLSMLEIPKDTDCAVLEMGMSGFGEIEKLSLAAEPDFAVITTIGTSHMEMLGSRENICRAKLEVLCGLRRGGVLLLNGDEPLLADVYGKSYSTLYVSTERENADFFAKNIRVETEGTRFDIVYRNRTVKDLYVRVVGKHNVYSALFAFAIGTLCKLSEDRIRAGLLTFAPEKLRQNIVSVGNMTLMEDCYNASPESMKAALDVLKAYTAITGGRSVAVLGDMLELGEESSELHRQIGAYAAKLGIAKLITVGKGGNYIAVGAKQGGMRSELIDTYVQYTDLDEIGASVMPSLKAGDVILFKASRALGIEGLIQFIKSQF